MDPVSWGGVAAIGMVFLGLGFFVRSLHHPETPCEEAPVVIKHEPARITVPDPPETHPGEVALMAQYVSGLNDVVRAERQSQAALLLRTHQDGFRQGYQLGWDDHQTRAPHRYRSVEPTINPTRAEAFNVTATFHGTKLHEDWCPIFLSADRGGGLCTCYFGRQFGAHTDG